MNNIANVKVHLRTGTGNVNIVDINNIKQHGTKKLQKLDVCVYTYEFM